MLFSSIARALRVLSLCVAVGVMMSSGGVAVRAAQATPDADAAASDGGQTLTFTPVADAYVEKDNPDSNFGDSDELNSDQDPMAVAYVQFEVEGIDRPVENATFRLWVTNSSDSIPVLWLSPPVPLDEESVTWNTRPALDDLVEEREAEGVEEDEWLEYDVGAVVTTDGLYTFALVPSSTNGVDAVSREGDERQPELVLDVGAGGATLLAAGDVATCTEGEQATARILDQSPGKIITLGDNSQEEGTAEQYEECYAPTWGRHKDRTHPAPGNHDYSTDDAEPYFDYFGDAAGEPGEGYYSFMLDDWKLIAINTNIDTDPESDQYEWVRTELEESTAQCTLVYGHHPRFSSGMHGSQAFMDPLFTLFYDYGVELYLSGHDHHYERFLPQDPSGARDDEQGVRQFVVGTGGAPTRPFDEIQDNSELRVTDVHGVLRLSLMEDGYEFEFLAVEGETFYDSGEADCHSAPDDSLSIQEERGLGQAYIATDARRLYGLTAPLFRVARS